MKHPFDLTAAKDSLEVFDLFEAFIEEWISKPVDPAPENELRKEDFQYSVKLPDELVRYIEICRRFPQLPLSGLASDTWLSTREIIAKLPEKKDASAWEISDDELHDFPNDPNHMLCFMQKDCGCCFFTLRQAENGQWDHWYFRSRQRHGKPWNLTDNLITLGLMSLMEQTQIFKSDAFEIMEYEGLPIWDGSFRFWYHPEEFLGRGGSTIATRTIAERERMKESLTKTVVEGRQRFEAILIEQPESIMVGRLSAEKYTNHSSINEHEVRFRLKDWRRESAPETESNSRPVWFRKTVRSDTDGRLQLRELREMKSEPVKVAGLIDPASLEESFRHPFAAGQFSTVTPYKDSVVTTAIARENLQNQADPDRYDDPNLGVLYYQPDHTWSGEAKWMGANLEWNLNVEEQAEISIHAKHIAKLFDPAQDWASKVNTEAIRSIYPIYLDWKDEGVDPLSHGDFVAKLGPYRVELSTDGSITIFFYGDEWFTEHHFVIQGTVDTGLTEGNLY